jgi:pyridoxine kinase
MPRVLAISSHVVRGHVGLCATVPALQSLGHEVWALPTVLLANRPGLGRLCKHELSEGDLAGMLSALEADGCWASVDAVLTGYFASPATVSAAAHAVARIRQANPRALVLVDPILGDAGRLYTDQETAAVIRSKLLPQAQVATPNLFEVQWLTGSAASSPADLEAAARGLGPQTVVVTSARETHDSVTTLLVTESQRIERSFAKHLGLPNGAGDLFAGLFLGALLNGKSPEAALDASLAVLDRVLVASAGQPVLQLWALHAASGPVESPS